MYRFRIFLRRLETMVFSWALKDNAFSDLRVLLLRRRSSSKALFLVDAWRILACREITQEYRMQRGGGGEGTLDENKIDISDAEFMIEVRVVHSYTARRGLSLRRIEIAIQVKSQTCLARELRSYYK